MNIGKYYIKIKLNKITINCFVANIAHGANIFFYLHVLDQMDAFVMFIPCSDVT